ncbi:fibronectin type III domain-containing protein, partial [Chloroflexota bacterium]
MNIRKWLILLLAIVTVMGLATYVGVTESFFVDNEQSTGDALGVKWGLFTLNDGFENTGSPAWDDLWDENGTTTWLQDSVKPNSGTYDARLSNTDTPGNLTSDEFDASSADNITVSFWYKPQALEAGDILIQTYNGTAYNTWWDLTTYPGYTNNAWNLFSEVITDSQYLIAGFRLRFNSSALGDSQEEINIDDVVVTTDTIPPAAPTGLVATPGNEEITLDWTSNNETDFWVYNVYRGPSSGNITNLVGSMLTSSDYTDTIYGGGLYFYEVTAVDFGNNESARSNTANATAVDVAPATAANLTATSGNEQIVLDWNDNIETDFDGYNVYRGPS